MTPTTGSNAPTNETGAGAGRREKPAGPPLTIVAEMACAHEGDLDMVERLTEVAAEAGVDVLQFQFFRAEETVPPSSAGRPLADKLELPLRSYRGMIERAQKLGLRVWATVSDLPSLEAVLPTPPERWRIHSTDIGNTELIDVLCGTGIPITFAVGGTTIEEIAEAVDYVNAKGGEVSALIHGFQGYPTPVEEANLSFIGTLRERFGLPVGYQDHTDGDDPLGLVLSAMAISYGAEIIERHFTLDRSQKGTDYHSSLNPDELKDFVRRIKRAHAAVGTDSKERFGAAETKYRERFKKSLVFRNDLSPGTVVKPEHLSTIRLEAVYLQGKDAPRIVGKTLKEAVQRYQPAAMELVE